MKTSVNISDSCQCWGCFLQWNEEIVVTGVRISQEVIEEPEKSVLQESTTPLHAALKNNHQKEKKEARGAHVDKRMKKKDPGSGIPAVFFHFLLSTGKSCQLFPHYSRGKQKEQSACFPIQVLCAEQNHGR